MLLSFSCALLRLQVAEGLPQVKPKLCEGTVALLLVPVFLQQITIELFVVTIRTSVWFAEVPAKDIVF